MTLAGFGARTGARVSQAGAGELGRGHRRVDPEAPIDLTGVREIDGGLPT